MPAPVSIVVPAFNQLEYCRQCVTSLQRNTAHPYRLILVDNGSTDGVGKYFDSVADAVVIHAATNRGFAGGVNLGLAQAEGHVCVLNSDTLLPAGWLGRLVEVLESDPAWGMVGPMTNYASGPQQIGGLTFQTLAEINAFAADRYAAHGIGVQPVSRLVGFCLLIRDRTLEAVGGFDERYGVGNFEDDDYCRRVREAGWRLGMAEGAFVFHCGNRTFAGMGIVDSQWDALLLKNHELYVQKWGTAGAGDAAVAPALNAAARAAYEEGRHRQALEQYLESLRRAPGVAETYNDLGAVLWELGLRERAYDAFVRALRLVPGYPEARKNLEDAAAVLGKRSDL